MIRIAKESDIPAMLAIYAPYVENTTVSFEYEVPTREEFSRRFLSITRQFPWLVWEENGQVLGYCYACAPFTRAAYQWCAEPSIYLAPQAKGRGIAQKLYEALEVILEKQGYQVLYALVTQENLPSLGFHGKMGYEKRMILPNCGFKQGRWLGLCWLEKRRKAVESPSQPPVSWLSIVQDRESLLNFLSSLSLS